MQKAQSGLLFNIIDLRRDLCDRFETRNGLKFTSAARISRHIEGFTSWTFSPKQNNHRVPIEMQFLFFFLRDAQESC